MRPIPLVLACGNTAAAPDQEVADCALDGGDPAASEYVLRYPEGRTYTVIQGNCPADPTWGHYGWYAYDFDLATGDTVIPSRAGRVRFVREDQPDIGGRCGVNGENLVVMEHGDGTVMLYVHLTTDGALVEAGRQVEQGEPIGLSGNSGCSSGPHLHVGLYRSSDRYDREDSRPFDYLNAAGPLVENRHLVQGQLYTAGPPEAIRP